MVGAAADEIAVHHARGVYINASGGLDVVATLGHRRDPAAHEVEAFPRAGLWLSAIYLVGAGLIWLTPKTADSRDSYSPETKMTGRSPADVQPQSKGAGGWLAETAHPVEMEQAVLRNVFLSRCRRFARPGRPKRCDPTPKH